MPLDPGIRNLAQMISALEEVASALDDDDLEEHWDMKALDVAVSTLESLTEDAQEAFSASEPEDQDDDAEEA